MRHHVIVPLVAAVASCATAMTIDEIEAKAIVAAAEVVARAEPANQPYGYTPQKVACPSNTPKIREATSLSDQETSWLEKRRNVTIDPMRDLLGRLNINGFDVSSFFNKHGKNASALPNIGIAVSGGGYRAMLNGAGVLEAMDSRTTNATAPGQIGGLLQSATYLSALSGGNWLVGSLFANNWTSIDQILSQDTSSTVSSSDLWQFGQNIFEGPKSDGIQLFGTAGYYSDLVNAVQGKNDAGFNTTITDYWGRALSYQLINATSGGPSYTFSSIADQEFFTNGLTPLPLIVSDGRAPGQTIVSENSTVYTFSPWELGSYDPTLYGFAPLQYVGTNFSNGSPVGSECVVGFDNMGYVMGTSSSLFNAILTTANQTNTTGLLSTTLKNALETVLETIGEADDDIADYPNPFYGFNKGINHNAESKQLTLVDGGEDGQNIPFQPLIQPIRHVDVIFAVDSSADTNTTYPTDNSAANWPAGYAIVATYQRSLVPISNGTAFPEVPSMNSFINLGLASRPTFFGCNNTDSSKSTPLVVYMPNGPYTFDSNTSTFDLEYSDAQRNAMVLNGYNMATQGNGTLDSQWPTCVGCAIIARSLTRTGTPLPSVCDACFSKYCWNGTTDDRTPGNYVPSLKLPQFESKVSAAGRTVQMGSWGALLTVFALIVAMGSV